MTLKDDALAAELATLRAENERLEAQCRALTEDLASVRADLESRAEAAERDKAKLAAANALLERVRGVHASTHDMMLVRGRECLVQLGTVYDDLAFLADQPASGPESETNKPRCVLHIDASSIRTRHDADRFRGLKPDRIEVHGLFSDPEVGAYMHSEVLAPMRLGAGASRDWAEIDRMSEWDQPAAPASTEAERP